MVLNSEWEEPAGTDTASRGVTRRDAPMVTRALCIQDFGGGGSGGCVIAGNLVATSWGTRSSRNRSRGVGSKTWAEGEAVTAQAIAILQEPGAPGAVWSVVGADGGASWDGAEDAWCIAVWSWTISVATSSTVPDADAVADATAPSRTAQGATAASAVAWVR